MSESPPESDVLLPRRLGLWQTTALNIANMVGIGPFITIPAFIAAMNGPHAIIGWVIAAVLVLCDGLVWSELGAALPGSGGSYHFLKVIFGSFRWGRILPFLFIWQFLVSGALEMASGYIGALGYLEFALPQLTATMSAWGVPGGTRIVAAAAVVLITLLLCQRVGRIGALGLVFCTGTLLTVVLVIVSGLTHFDSSLLAIPENAFRLDSQFALGLGGAMLIAVYDYLGYFNVCHLGDEVRDPARTIPRSILISIVVIACLYLTMNVSIMAVVPWQEAMLSKNIAADFMERLFGTRVALAFTWLIIWTAMAGMFALTLAYSRIPFAAARAGDFFAVFGQVHSRDRYPVVSLLILGAFTAGFCFLSLQSVIEAAVCVRIIIQFVGQILALHILRTQRRDIALPFRMWFYPLPSIVALVGWLYVLGTAKWEILGLSAAVMASGIVAYFLWQSPISWTRLGKFLVPFGWLCVIATATTLLARWSWVCELLSHFRVQSMVGSMVFMIICFLAKHRWTAGLLLICTLWHAWTISACWLPIQDRPQTSATGFSPIRIYSTNVLTPNQNYSALIRRVEEIEPDVIVLIEIDQTWLDELTPLHKRYPYRLAEPFSGNFGIAIFSQLPLEHPEVIRLNVGIPCIRSTITKQAHSIQLFGVHLLNPLVPKYAATRNHQLVELAKLTASNPESVLVGDLNCTPWSPYFTDLLSSGRLRNTQVGRGIQSSWPVGNPVLRIPIDHALIGPMVTCFSRRLDDPIGSDHLPLVVEVVGKPN